METTNKYQVAGLIFLALFIVGNETYEAYLSGEELVCRTNKPTGWNIIEQHDGFAEAICPYKSRDPIVANCKSFRSTGSYDRYGCEEVFLVKVVENVVNAPSDINFQCGKNGCW